MEQGAARPRVAVVGAGSAGLVTAWLLDAACEVVLFEAADRPGGHAHSVEVDVGDRRVVIEMGAEMIFERPYAGLLALTDRLGVPRSTRPISCTSMLADSSLLALPPRNAAGVLRCLPPRGLRRLWWLRSLALAARRVVADVEWDLTVAGLIDRVGIPGDVVADLVVPMVAASWGVEREAAVEMAAYSVVSVTGMGLTHDPHTVLFDGGLAAYVRALIGDMPAVELRLATAVGSVRPEAGGLRVDDDPRLFDAVVLACDWRSAARLCADPRLAPWQRVFAAVEDYPVHLAAHRDPGLLPAPRALWGAANFDFRGPGCPRNTMWSGLRHGLDLFRTWLRPGEAPPGSTVCEARYRHVMLDPAHHRRQARLAELQGLGALYAAGMYTTGVDNHESAIRSAVYVAERLAPASPRLAWLKAHVRGPDGGAFSATSGAAPAAA